MQFTSCDHKELKGLWTSETLCDLNASCRPSEGSLYGVEAYMYILFTSH